VEVATQTANMVVERDVTIASHVSAPHDVRSRQKAAAPRRLPTIESIIA
jgi:hypothetical protein